MILRRIFGIYPSKNPRAVTYNTVAVLRESMRYTVWDMNLDERNGTMIMTAKQQNKRLNRYPDSGNNTHTTLEQEVAR